LTRLDSDFKFHSFLGEPPEIYSKFIKDAPAIGIGYANRAFGYLNLGQVQLAIEDYKQAFQLDSSLKEVLGNVYYNIAYQMIDRGMLDEAKKILDFGIKEDPKDIKSLNELAFIANRKNDYLQCIEYASLSIKVSEQNPNGFVHRGTCYYQIKKRDLSLNDFNQALKLNPNQFEALYSRCTIYAQMKNCKAAYEDAVRAIKVDPSIKNYLQKVLSVECGNTKPL